MMRFRQYVRDIIEKSALDIREYRKIENYEYIYHADDGRDKRNIYMQLMRD